MSCSELVQDISSPELLCERFHSSSTQQTTAACFLAGTLSVLSCSTCMYYDILVVYEVLYCVVGDDPSKGKATEAMKRGDRKQGGSCKDLKTSTDASYLRTPPCPKVQGPFIFNINIQTVLMFRYILVSLSS